jgi:RNA polymerase sigma-B factor
MGPALTPSALARPLPAADGDASRLFVRWQRERDRRAREALVEQFTPLARALARRYRQSPVPMEDLVQVALLGLLKAIDRFDPARGSKFQSFAIPTILGELRRHFRDSAWGVHVPRGAQERALAVQGAREHLSNTTGRAPTVHELAQYLELDSEQVLAGLQALHAYHAVSLDAPRAESEDETLLDSLASDETGYELAEQWGDIASVLDRLDVRDRKILRLRFVDELTQTEIAGIVGISQMQVSRLLRQALDSLRKMIDGKEQ